MVIDTELTITLKIVTTFNEDYFFIRECDTVVFGPGQ